MNLVFDGVAKITTEALRRTVEATVPPTKSIVTVITLLLYINHYK